MKICLNCKAQISKRKKYFCNAKCKKEKRDTQFKTMFGFARGWSNHKNLSVIKLVPRIYQTITILPTEDIREYINYK